MTVARYKGPIFIGASTYVGTSASEWVDAKDFDAVEADALKYRRLQGECPSDFLAGERVEFRSGEHVDHGTVQDSTNYKGRVLVKWDRDFEMVSLADARCLFAIQSPPPALEKQP